MKKTSFKGLVFLLTLSMIFTILTPATASANAPTTKILQTKDISMDNYDLNTVKDNKLETIIETEEDGKKIRSTYNKVTQIITITTEGEDPIVIDLSDAYKQSEEVPEITPFSIIAQENTWTNYEYTIRTGNKWELRRPNPSSPALKTLYKNVTYNSKNKTNLNNFKSSVDKLNTAEWKYLGTGITVPLGIIATIITGAITGGSAAIAVGLATAGVTGAAANYALQMHRHAKDAYYYYFLV